MYRELPRSAEFEPLIISWQGLAIRACLKGGGNSTGRTMPDMNPRACLETLARQSRDHESIKEPCPSIGEDAQRTEADSSAAAHHPIPNYTGVTPRREKTYPSVTSIKSLVGLSVSPGSQGFCSLESVQLRALMRSYAEPRTSEPGTTS
jgi:hypothetical protein